MRDCPRDGDTMSVDVRVGDSSVSPMGLASARDLTLLLLEPRVRWLVVGELGGSFDIFEGILFGDGRKGSSPGTASSVKPDRELGAFASTAMGGD